MTTEQTISNGVSDGSAVAGHAEPALVNELGERRIVGKLGWFGPLNLCAMLFPTIATSAASALSGFTFTAVLPEARANSAIGLQSMFGALSGAIFAVLIGHLSDKTRSRMGRRNPWILGGSIACMVGLLGLAFADYRMIWPAVVSLCIFQAGLNTYYSAYNALLPDRVDSSLLGRASAYSGFGSLAGSAIGTILNQVLIAIFGTGHITRGFLTLPWAMLIVAVVVVLALPGADLRKMKDSQKKTGEDSQNVPSPKTAKFRLPADRDFWLAYVGRFFIVLAIMLVMQTGTQIQRYYFGLDIKSAAAVGSISGLIMAVVGAFSSIIGGVASDKIGKRKPLLAVSAALVIIGLVILASRKALALFYVYTALAALAYGIFQAVDQALMVQVLPDKENAAQDMGILGTTNTLTGVIAGAVGAALIAGIGYRLMFLLAALFALVGILAFIPIKRVR
ncbi:MFS transporter [Bifidobacterium sp. ESL0764]|uniref:MFS transporter n=1 Tax=Bifidobacterium sp. ESL0764 TaxID=2983228 RepID=UPI0023FA06DC|nr:MFS transporter [Bifidobacterium sp. ESL0764]WEV65211.1 MFS transporter [Bifidobacterium sp. ESL0764]